MNNILDEVGELKELIIKSNEYKNYKLLEDKLDKNKEINKIVDLIKEKQKLIIKKESKKEKTEKEEFELENLFKKLSNYDIYNEYINSAKELNKLITKVQKKFEDCFNDIIN